ncbi:hypothetical protein ACFQGT_18055 [Natrialbaceae archaeon GCM10025810]
MNTADDRVTVTAPTDSVVADKDALDRRPARHGQATHHAAGLPRGCHDQVAVAYMTLMQCRTLCSVATERLSNSRASASQPPPASMTVPPPSGAPPQRIVAASLAAPDREATVATWLALLVTHVGVVTTRREHTRG